MARKAAAIQQLVRINCRRFKPSDLPLRSANSLMRASTFFWIALCEGGKYSPFDTIWVGTGVAADAASAPATRRCSRSLSQLPIVRPPCLVIDQLPVVNGRRLRPGSAQIMTRGFPSGLDYDVVCWNGAAIEDNEPAVLLARQYRHAAALYKGNVELHLMEDGCLSS